MRNKINNINEKFFDIECELSIVENLIDILLEHASEHHAGMAEILDIIQSKLLKIFDIIKK